MKLWDWISRRRLLQGTILAGAGHQLIGATAGEQEVYRRIGVQPVINCRGTFTILSGSQTLPEVKRAMDEASRHYVHLDELMNGVSARLAELTKAEWGIVTAGCAAALTHATAACIAGADPEKMQRLPDLRGMKNEVVMPRQSRNVYDHAIRMLGVRIVTTDTREQFLAALGPQTAMIALLGESMRSHPITLPEMAEAARPKGIPIIVDAAAERPTIPDVYLQAGADMVAYSGGKCIRGPQCAGLLLGKKDLLQAAWLNSAPHHAFGRSLKVGKEEIMGMLAAVEMWVKRDHDAEWKQWEGWLGTIREKVSSVPTVTTEILQPRGPSNYAPQLRIKFDKAKLGMSGFEIAEVLAKGSPRIIVPAADSALTIMPYMMMPGDDKVVAEKLRQVMANARPAPAPASPQVSGNTLTGQWDVEIRYVRGDATHHLFIEQKGGEVVGHHRGDILSGDARGSFDGQRLKLRSSHRYEGTSIGYSFDGVLEGEVIKGKVELGEYGSAQFTAKRHFKA